MTDSKQLARMLGVSESSLRRWVKVFSEGFSENAKKRRGRFYTDSDIAAAGKINELFQLGFKEEQVRKALAKVIDATIEEKRSTAFEYMVPKMEQSIFEIRQSQQQILDIQKDHDHHLNRHQVYFDKWVSNYNEFQRKPALVRFWLTITGQAPSKPPVDF